MFASLLKTRRQKLVVQPHYHRFGQTSLRNALFTLYKQVISNLVFKSANAIIVNSSYEEKAVKKDFVHSRNVIKLMQGLPVNEIREFKWCPENPKRILSVGALRRYKNVDRLVIAFNHLLNNSAEDLRLVIIGDGPEKRKIANLVGKMGIAKNVELKHNLSKLQLYSEYSKARVFVSLSYLESFSRTIHEAQIIGVPIVTLEKVIKSGLANELTAIGIESIKPEDISAAISKAISKNPTHSNASNSIVPSINHYANQVAEMYRKLIAN
jgi:glycosyltransferase involved in cell wall biosynthesis